MWTTVVLVTKWPRSCTCGAVPSPPEVQGNCSVVVLPAPFGPRKLFQRQSEIAQLISPIGSNGEVPEQVVRRWWEVRKDTGSRFRCYGVWGEAAQADELIGQSPAGHGAREYSETNIVWPEWYREKGFGMFRWFAGAGYFGSAPI